MLQWCGGLVGWLEGDVAAIGASGAAVHSFLALIFRCHLPPSRAECWLLVVSPAFCLPARPIKVGSGGCWAGACVGLVCRWR